jgi:hypothetical protein
MRVMLLIGCCLALRAACGHDEASSQFVCGAPSQVCLDRLCITSVAHFGSADCCDSVVCNCNPETKQWETQFCDPAPPDAAVDAGADATLDAAAVDAAIDAH